MEKIIKENDLYAHFLQYSYKELKELFKKSKTKEFHLIKKQLFQAKVLLKI